MDAMTQHERPPVELKGWQHGAIFLFACLLMLVRRPDAVLHAQFWAEDGRVFFADAYNLGWWPALFRAYDGYFHLAPRLAASFALLAPLTLAPLITNLIAIAIQALPVNLLLGARSAGWGSLRYRFWLAGVYLALPNCSEISYGITNSQWVLALSAFLLLVASPAKSAEGRIASLCFLVFAGLTGPFCIFLFPIALCVAWRRRVAWRWVQASVLAVCGLVQAWCLLVIDPAGRIHSPLGASLPLFSRILGGHILRCRITGEQRSGRARPPGSCRTARRNRGRWHPVRRDLLCPDGIRDAAVSGALGHHFGRIAGLPDDLFPTRTDTVAAASRDSRHALLVLSHARLRLVDSMGCAQPNRMASQVVDCASMRPVRRRRPRLEAVRAGGFQIRGVCRAVRCGAAGNADDDSAEPRRVEHAAPQTRFPLSRASISSYDSCSPTRR